MGSLLGFIGAALFVLSYFMLQANKDFARTITYSLMNLTGAGFMLWSLAYDWNLGALINNGFWVVLSFYGIWQALPKAALPSFKWPRHLSPLRAKL